MCGSELFTGNTALCFAAWLEGKASIGGVLKNWVCAYAGNILGCCLMVSIFSNTGLMPQLTRGAEALAIYKTAAPFKEVRGCGTTVWPDLYCAGDVFMDLCLPGLGCHSRLVHASN